MAETNVDILAEAREAQWSALAFLGEDAIKVITPAKVNLFLGVGARKPDGYHNVNTAMHALSLHDVLFMTCSNGAPEGDGYVFAGPSGNVAVRIDVADKTSFLGAPGASVALDIPTEKNLAFKAIDLLAKEIALAGEWQVSIRIEKHIPAQAGLGGGSSDAAAALLGMSHFWDIDNSADTIETVAAMVGSDVPFFLRGGCGYFVGQGQEFSHAIEPMKHPVVLVKPDAGVSTKEAYGRFDESPVIVPAELLAQVEGAVSADNVPLFNNLEPAAASLAPEIADAVEWLKAQDGIAVGEDGQSKVLLSGSGSCVYAVTPSYDDALKVSTAANARGYWSRATAFSSLRAAKV